MTAQPERSHPLEPEPRVPRTINGTHQGKYQARLAGDIVAGRSQQAWADHRAVPP